MEENLLIQSARKGDLDSYNQLVLLHQQVAFNLALRMLDDSDDAEDVTQTAFISAYRNLGGFRGGSFRAWLLRMVTNACYDEMRRRQRKPTQPLEPESEENDGEIESPAWLADPNAADPLDSLEKDELEHAISHCLKKLPEDFRAVVVMVDIEGLEYSEVSAAVSVPLGTIKSRVARARLRLRDCLQRFGELLPERFRLMNEGTE